MDGYFQMMDVPTLQGRLSKSTQRVLIIDSSSKATDDLSWRCFVGLKYYKVGWTHDPQKGKEGQLC